MSKISSMVNYWLICTPLVIRYTCDNSVIDVWEYIRFLNAFFVFNRHKWWKRVLKRLQSEKICLECITLVKNRYGLSVCALNKNWVGKILFFIDWSIFRWRFNGNSHYASSTTSQKWLVIKWCRKSKTIATKPRWPKKSCSCSTGKLKSLFPNFDSICCVFYI